MDKDKKRILVTGGTGLVGKAIERIVSQEKDPDEEWIFIGSKDADLSKSDETQAIFETYKPTHVLHLAAMTKLVTQSMKPCYAKRLLDVQNHAYHEQYDKLYTAVIPTNVFGPHDNFNLVNSHVLPALIHKTYLAQKNGTPLFIQGSAQAKRQFVYSLDLGHLMIWAMHHYNEVEPIILSGKLRIHHILHMALYTVDEADEVTIEHCIKEIVRVFGFTGPIYYDLTFSDGQLKKTASNRKLRGYLPDFEFTPMSSAIEDTIQWFQANYETARK